MNEIPKRPPFIGNHDRKGNVIDEVGSKEAKRHGEKIEKKVKILDMQSGWDMKPHDKERIKDGLEGARDDTVEPGIKVAHERLGLVAHTRRLALAPMLNLIAEQYGIGPIARASRRRLIRVHGIRVVALVRRLV